METIYDVIQHAKTSPCFKTGLKTHFCSMLDGEGCEVFDVLRASFARARERSSGHVVMTATLTANKRSWRPAEEEAASAAVNMDELEEFESYDAVLRELNLW